MNEENNRFGQRFPSIQSLVIRIVEKNFDDDDPHESPPWFFTEKTIYDSLPCLDKHCKHGGLNMFLIVDQAQAKKETQITATKRCKKNGAPNSSCMAYYEYDLHICYRDDSND